MWHMSETSIDRSCRDKLALRDVEGKAGLLAVAGAGAGTWSLSFEFCSNRPSQRHVYSADNSGFNQNVNK